MSYKKLITLGMLLLVIHTAVAVRIISLSPNITRTLITIGASSDIIAVDSESHHLQGLSELPIVASYQQINIEKIIGMHPDYVFAWPVQAQQQQLQQLQRFNIRVIYLEQHHLADVAKLANTLGYLTHHQQQAAAVAQDYMNHLEALEQKYQNSPRVKVFYQVWRQPLATLNNQTVVGQMLQLCGADNVFGDDNRPFIPVTLESVVKRHPKVVITNIAAYQNFWHQWLPGSQVIVLPGYFSEQYTPEVLNSAELLCSDLDNVR